MAKQSFGQIGEKVAENYLIAQGYKILDSNFFNPRGYRIGEIDLVTEDKDQNIVFIEVKCRKGKKDEVVPEENITNNKIRKIIKAANFYLSKNNLIGRNWRIDSVGIIFDYATRKLNIRHIKAIRV